MKKGTVALRCAGASGVAASHTGPMKTTVKQKTLDDFFAFVRRTAFFSRIKITF
jgi:hypothetical protein